MAPQENQEKMNSEDKLRLTDQEWRQRLTPEQYAITREKGTERPFTGEYYEMDEEEGVFRCVCCGAPLFSTEHKYHSGSGWPSFWQPMKDEAVETEEDFSYGMNRTEVKCRHCDAHLGHVFEDGPDPTGLRYCINSAALTFEEEKG